MSRNLARARSHLIMIAALIAGSGYILVVERDEARRDAERAIAVSAQAAARDGWEADLGAFRGASDAGAAWDAAVARKPELAGLRIVLEPTGTGLMLKARPFASKREVDALCGQVRSAGLSCTARAPQ